MATESSPIYRSLHGAPMLAGVPAHYALTLMGVAALRVVGGVLLTWGLLAFVFAQDRVQVPLYFLRLFHRFPRRITSYSRSYQRVVIED